MRTSTTVCVTKFANEDIKSLKINISLIFSFKKYTWITYSYQIHIILSNLTILRDIVNLVIDWALLVFMEKKSSFANFSDIHLIMLVCPQKW